MGIHKKDIFIEKSYNAKSKMIIFRDTRSKTELVVRLKKKCNKNTKRDTQADPAESDSEYSRMPKQPKSRRLIGKEFLGKFHLIKEISVSVFSESTFHGLSRVIKANTCLIKFVWLTFLLLCICLFAKFAINSFANYFEYRVSTELRTIYETPTIFPTVSICNKNKFTTDHGIHMIKNKIASLNFSDIFNMTVLKKMSMRDRFHTVDDGVSLASNEIFKYPDEERKKLGRTLNDFLVECKFDNIDCNLEEDFVWFFDNVYGNCYKYNSGVSAKGEKMGLKMSKVPGKYYLGLKLTLFDSLPRLLKRTAVNGNGFVIRVENSSYKVDGNSEIDLLSGVETSVSVERVYATQLAYPYSNCHVDDEAERTFHSDLYDLFVKHGKQYKQTDCLELCQNRVFLDTCNCTIIDMFSVFNATNCNSNTEMTCLYKVYHDKVLAPNFFKENCYPLCPLECSTTQYKTYQTSNLFDPEIYLDVVRERTNFLSEYDDQTLSDAAIRSGLVKVNIYYESLSYTQVQETVKINEVSLIATIGGFMGMFLGASLMTFVEIFDIMIKFFMRKSNEKKARLSMPI